MPTIDLERFRSQGKRFVDGFTPGQKAMTILGIVAVVLAGMMFTRWAGATDYAPLYTSLSGADAGKVTQALDSAGVKWKLADGGATVLVPSDMVYKERVALSAQGLPGSSEGLALLDKQGITASEFVQRVDYQRAMQGELEKTIGAIDGVAAVKINLTIPPDQVFEGATVESPSAAVLVTTGGTALSGDSVQAIVHLVASSIPHMDPDSVTVADSNGNVLNAPGADLSSGRGLKQQTAFNTVLGAAVTKYIGAALGPNHANVQVQADLNFDEQKTTSLANKAGKNARGSSGPLPSEQTTSQEKFTGSGNVANGVLGVGNTQSGNSAQTPESYEKTQTQTKNAVDQVQTEIQQAPGKIDRLSVAVMLDSSVVKPADVADWTRQIKAAVGYDRTRGDVVQVTPIAFSADAQKAAKEQLKAGSGGGTPGMMDMARYVITLAIIALVLFFSWRAIKKAEANRVPLRVPIDLRELEAADVRALEASAAQPALTDAEGRALPPALDSGRQGDLTDLIEHQPDEVAQTLRSWLADRRT